MRARPEWSESLDGFCINSESSGWGSYKTPNRFLLPGNRLDFINMGVQENPQEDLFPFCRKPCCVQDLKDVPVERPDQKHREPCPESVCWGGSCSESGLRPRRFQSTYRLEKEAPPLAGLRPSPPRRRWRKHSTNVHLRACRGNSPVPYAAHGGKLCESLIYRYR